ncbi:MAG: transcription elongation factor GreAB [Hymenobacter sp.]
MSRAFTKEGDVQAAPIVPPRAALPPGTPNYVTPQGLAQLRAERTALEAEHTAAEANHDNDTDRTHRLSLLNGRLGLLTERITSAKVIDPHAQPAKEVRFGATVRLRTVSGGTVGFERNFTIVGVDEADVAAGQGGLRGAHCPRHYRREAGQNGHAAAGAPAGSGGSSKY